MTARPSACQPALAGRRTVSHRSFMPDNDKEREERLAAALRENLRKRKAQARQIDKPKSDDQS